MKLHRSLVWLVALALAAMLLGGCAQQSKKPVPNSPNGKTPYSTSKGASPANPTPNNERIMANRFSQTAIGVPGVDRATVVVQKNVGKDTYTCMVGLELKPGTSGTDTNAIKKEVAKRIKAQDARVTQVLVTADPNLVTRIKDIASGVIKGRPVSSFSSEIKELARRIAPTM